LWQKRWPSDKDAELYFKQISYPWQLLMMMDDSYLQTSESRGLYWEIALMSSRFCWFHETSSAKNSLWLLVVLDSKVLHMNKYWATFSGYFLFYDECLKFSFQVWSCILDIQRFLSLLLDIYSNIITIKYLINSWILY